MSLVFNEEKKVKALGVAHRWMRQQQSPARKGHHGSHSAEQWNHDCGRAAEFGRSRALPRRHQATLLLDGSKNISRESLVAAQG